MKHYNPSITERANRIFNLKNGDGMSEEIDGPVAVIPITPITTLYKGAAAAGTLYTTPTDRDTYLSFVSLSFAKSAADTGVTVIVSCTLANGGGGAQFGMQGITLTADAQSIAYPFPLPMKLERGSNIALTVSGTYTSVRASVLLYQEEVTRT